MDLVLDLPIGDLEVLVPRPPDVLVHPPRVATVFVVPTRERRLPLEDTPGKADLRVMLDEPDPGTRGIHHELVQKRGLDTREQGQKYRCRA